MEKELKVDTALMRKVRALHLDENAKKRTNFKVLSYVSERDCIDCFLNHVCFWEVFQNQIMDMHLSVEYFFIIECGDSDEKRICKELKASPIANCIWLDSKRVFCGQNPYIPEEDVFHTFLLDENNRIIIVGDPTESDEIEKLYINTIMGTTSGQRQMKNN